MADPNAPSSGPRGLGGDAGSDPYDADDLAVDPGASGAYAEGGAYVPPADVSPRAQLRRAAEAFQPGAFAGEPAQAAVEPPFNLEAEQALLGAILYDNDVIGRVADMISAEHFYDPVHGRIYEQAALLVQKGLVASATLLKDRIPSEALEALGGESYLGVLLSRAAPPHDAHAYAQTIVDLAQRRELIGVGRDVASKAHDKSSDVTAKAIIEETEQRLFKLAETGSAKGGFIPMREALRRSIDAAKAAFAREGKLSGCTTGLIDLDRQLGGMHRSDLIILAGRPSMGKTSLATNIAVNAARAYRREPDANGVLKTAEGAVVAFYSLEMSAEQLATRVLAEEARISSHRIRTGELTKEEFERLKDAAQRLADLPMIIEETGGITIGALAARARRQARSKQGLDLIVVDYLQLVTTGGKSSDGRVQEVSMITQGLKALAKELSVPIIALSQLSRKVEDREDKRPQLSDLRESGSIEQDADVVMFVYREAYYKEREEPKEGTEEHFKWQDDLDAIRNVAEVVIGKQRHGPIGIVKLSFEGEFTKFGNLEQRYGESGPR